MAGFKKANPSNDRPRAGVDPYSSTYSRDRGMNDGGRRNHRMGLNGHSRDPRSTTYTHSSTKSAIPFRRGRDRSRSGSLSPFRRGRDRSRSGSPYRSSRLSPSPPRFSQKKSSSPYPYRRSNRSPSPRRRDDRTSSPHHSSEGDDWGHGRKRHASPHLEGRPEKRAYLNYNKTLDHGTHNTDKRTDLRQSQHDMNLSRSTVNSSSSTPNRAPKAEDAMPSAVKDSLQTDQPHSEIIDGEEDFLKPPQEDKVPTEEEREKKKATWAAMRAQSASLSTTPAPGSPATASDQAPNSTMIVDKNTSSGELVSPAVEDASAADYDPTEDDRTRIARISKLSEVSSENIKSSLDAVSVPKVPPPQKKEKKEVDMFASDFEDDDDDEDDVPKEGRVLDARLLDNWDDPEGYYKIIHNERIGPAGRYKVTKTLGKGVFANVVQAEDNEVEDKHKHKLVAIKIIRKNAMMRAASQKEASFLRTLNESDPGDRMHIVRLFGSFDHKGHLCIIFEHLDRNLRDVLKELTGGHGVSFKALVSFARQMFLGLQHLQDCYILHADLKPDNILVSLDKRTIKIADFGTAVDIRDQNDSTDELASRFYRAPEVILGMPVGHPIDMWAIGCTLFEMWTGKILFAGRHNNEMLAVMIEGLGWPSEKYLLRGQLTPLYFESGPPTKFLQQNKTFVKKLEQHKNPGNIMARVRDGAKGLTDPPSNLEIIALVELLQSCLNWYPEKRLSPKAAQDHRFFKLSRLTPAFPATKPVLKPVQATHSKTGKRW